MVTMADFVQKYFAVFLLGAVFGKVIELSGSAASISKAIVGFLGPKRAMLAIVLACAVLTYGGVSLFVVAFAVYPFAASLFREAKLPKRLIPGTIALGSFTFTMDALPGTPQIQNIIPTTFFGTTIYAAPILGTFGAVLVLGCGMVLPGAASPASDCRRRRLWGRARQRARGRTSGRQTAESLAGHPAAGGCGRGQLGSHAMHPGLVRRVVRLRGHRAAGVSRGEDRQRRGDLVDRTRPAGRNRRRPWRSDTRGSCRPSRAAWRTRSAAPCWPR